MRANTGVTHQGTKHIPARPGGSVGQELHAFYSRLHSDFLCLVTEEARGRKSAWLSCTLGVLVVLGDAGCVRLHSTGQKVSCCWDLCRRPAACRSVCDACSRGSAQRAPHLDLAAPESAAAVQASKVRARTARQVCVHLGLLDRLAAVTAVEPHHGSPRTGCAPMVPDTSTAQLALCYPKPRSICLSAGGALLGVPDSRLLFSFRFTTGIWPDPIAHVQPSSTTFANVQGPFAKAIEQKFTIGRQSSCRTSGTRGKALYASDGPVAAADPLGAEKGPRPDHSRSPGRQGARHQA